MPTCTQCGNEFVAKRADAAYCSAACRKRASRDIEGHVTDSDVTDNPDALRAQANELVRQQRDHRGYVPGPEVDGKPSLVLDRYTPTPQSEARAAQILRLRRRAARLEHPV